MQNYIKLIRLEMKLTYLQCLYFKNCCPTGICCIFIPGFKYFKLFYSQSNNIYLIALVMNRWYLCDGDTKSAQWERQSDSYYDCNLFPEPQTQNYQQLKKKNKPHRKPSLKTSLSEVRLIQKNKQRQYISLARAYTKITPQSSPKSNPPNTYLANQKYPLPKMPLTNIKILPFNTEVCQAYCTYPKLPTSPIKSYPQKPPLNKNVKINYLPSVQTSTNVGGNMIIRQPLINQHKNLIFLPSKINSQVFIDNKKEAEKRQKTFQLSKSMDYKESKIQVSSTKNLHEIQCIKAQSIPDSQQNEDQISYVLQSEYQGYQFSYRM